MSLILVSSIVLRLVALAWSVVLLKRIRDWRMGFLSIMLGLMALRQMLTLRSTFESWPLSFTGQTNELPGLVVSLMAFLSVFFLEKILTERKKLELEMMQISASEQQRIGRDLHDGIGQELTGIGYLAGALRDKLTQRSAEEAREAEEIAALIKSTIADTRALVKGLCPVPDETDGLADGLRELAETTETLHSIRCECQLDPNLFFHDHETANHLFFIAKEAVHNAVKHSGTDQILLSLFEQNGRIRLEIRDFGIGMTGSPGKNTSVQGRGMKIMKHRAAMINARIELRPHRNGGLSVICHHRQNHRNTADRPIPTAENKTDREPARTEV